MDREGSRSLRTHFAAFISYLAVAGVHTFPLLTKFGTYFPGRKVDKDVFGFLWNNWWIYHAITYLHTKPYVTDYIFAPWSIDLRLHTFGLLYGLLSLPVMPFLGPVVVLNAQIFLTVALNGYSSFRLTHYLTGNPSVSFLSGLVVASSPAIDFHLDAGRPSCAALWPAVCVLYFGLRLLEARRVSVAAALALAVVATLVVDQQIALFCAFWVVVLSGHLVLTRGREVLDRRFAALAAVVVLISLVPAYLLYYRPLTRDTGYTVPDATEALNYSVPPSVFADPALVWHAYGLALPCALVAGLVMTRRWPELRPWVIGSIAFLVLAMGPLLPGTRFPLPFALIRGLPGLSQFRTPYRFQMPAALGMSVAGGLVLARLVAPLQARTARGLLAVVGVFIAGDAVAHRLLEGFSIQTMPSEPFYAEIARDPRDCLVLEIPVGVRTGTDRIGPGEALSFYQATHGKRLINGFAARVPLVALNYYRQSPALMMLANESPPPGDIESDLKSRLNELRWLRRGAPGDGRTGAAPAGARPAERSGRSTSRSVERRSDRFSEVGYRDLTPVGEQVAPYEAGRAGLPGRPCCTAWISSGRGFGVGVPRAHAVTPETAATMAVLRRGGRGPARFGTPPDGFLTREMGCPAGTQGALLACMARLLAFELALVGLVSVFAGGAGCSSTGSNPGAADAAAMTTDGDGAVSDDGPIDALSLADGGCVPSLGAPCTADETPCQPKDLCSIGYEWFCSAISNSWQKSLLSCGDTATCTLGAACSSTELCMGGIAGCTSNCECLGGKWQEVPCPTDLPQTRSACTPIGAECGYPTPSTNGCGGESCICGNAGTWSCEPIPCVRVAGDASAGPDTGADAATDSAPFDASGG